MAAQPPESGAAEGSGEGSRPARLPCSDPCRPPHGHDPHPRRAYPQPEEPRSRSAARPADRHHRPVRLGQELARLRHHLRRRPAPLRRIAVGLRSAVPVGDGKARRRSHRGAFAGDLDRAEVHVAQPAFDRRHDHRDLRLPAPAVRARRHAALSRPWFPAGSADRQPDGGPGAGARSGAALHAAGAGGARTQGRTRTGVRATPRPGLRARARQRPDLRDRPGAGAGPAQQAFDRSGDRPFQAARRPQATPGGELRNRAQARRRPRLGHEHR